MHWSAWWSTGGSLSPCASVQNEAKYATGAAAQRLQTLFETELDGLLLGEMLEAMDTTWPAVHRNAHSAPDAHDGPVVTRSATEEQSQPHLLEDAGPPQPVAAAEAVVQSLAAAAVSEQRCAADSGLATAHAGRCDVGNRSGGTASGASSRHVARHHEHAQQVLGMLQALTRAGRFALARQLMGAKGHSAAQSIIERLRTQAQALQHPASKADDIKAVAAAYGVDM